MIAYHVAKKANLLSILRRGLIPQVGVRSASPTSDGHPLENIRRIYLFPSKEDCETALDQWLGDEFEDVEEFGLAILEVNLEGLSPYSTCPYEVCTEARIDPARILNTFEEDWSEMSAEDLWAASHSRRENPKEDGPSFP